MIEQRLALRVGPGPERAHARLQSIDSPTEQRHRLGLRRLRSVGGSATAVEERQSFFEVSAQGALLLQHFRQGVFTFCDAVQCRQFILKALLMQLQLLSASGDHVDGQLQRGHGVLGARPTTVLTSHRLPQRGDLVAQRGQPSNVPSLILCAARKVAGQLHLLTRADHCKRLLRAIEPPIHRCERAFDGLLRLLLPFAHAVQRDALRAPQLALVVQSCVQRGKRLREIVPRFLRRLDATRAPLDDRQMLTQFGDLALASGQRGLEGGNVPREPIHARHRGVQLCLEPVRDRLGGHCYPPIANTLPTSTTASSARISLSAASIAEPGA